MQEIAYKTRALLDEYTDQGVIISDSDVSDINAKIILFADAAQKEMYSIAKIEKEFKFNNKPFINKISGNNFEQVDFVGTDQEYPVNGVVGAKAYYFESTGSGTATIQEYDGSTWNTLTTVSMPFGTPYVAYSGLIIASNTNYPIRIKFSGTTFYRHTNRCLYSIPFVNGMVPPFRAWINVSLPSDFMSVSQIIAEFNQEYTEEIDYKWEADKLYISYNFDGAYRMTYRPIPITITTLSQNIECNAIIAQAIPYYCAAKIAPYENKSIVNFCQDEYIRLKQELTKPRARSWEKVRNIYTLGGV